MGKIYISIPATPPSVNVYVRHARGGHYKTPEAKAFATHVALCAGKHRNANIEAECVEITITLGKGQRMDIDNCAKVILDSLVRCGVIRSDATIRHLVIGKCRGENPQTEIWIS